MFFLFSATMMHTIQHTDLQKIMNLLASVLVVVLVYNIAYYVRYNIFLMSCSAHDLKIWIQESVLRFLYMIIFLLSLTPLRAAGVRFTAIRNLNFLKTSR